MKENVAQVLSEIIDKLKDLYTDIGESESPTRTLYSHCIRGLEQVWESVSQELQETVLLTEEKSINYDSFVFEEREHIVLNQYVGFDDEELIIPDYYNGKPVLEIADNVFAKCKHLKRVQLGRFVNIIGATAFKECENLTAVTNGYNVVYIGDGCFANCSCLDTFEWSDSLKFVGVAAFAKTNLKRVVIPSSLRYISSNMFEGCTALDEVVLHNDIIRICNSAFSRCKALTTINLPASLKHVEDKAFMDCFALFEVEIHTIDATWEENVFSKEIYHRPDLRYNPWYTYSPLDNVSIKCYPNSTIQNYCRLATIKCVRLDKPRVDCVPLEDVIIGVKVEKSRYCGKDDLNDGILYLLKNCKVKYIHKQETRLIDVRDAYYFLEPISDRVVQELKRRESQSYKIRCLDLVGKYFAN